MKVILIVGKKRSGKDTLAGMMKSELLQQGKNVEIYHFADNLKQKVAKMLNISLKQLNSFKNKKEEFRKLLQYTGDSFKIVYGQYFWAELLLNQLICEIQHKKLDYVIISDYRYLVESKKMEELKYYIEGNIDLEFIKVVGNNIDVADNHSSETELDEIAFPNVIYNTGTTKELHKKAVELLKKL